MQGFVRRICLVLIVALVLGICCACRSNLVPTEGIVPGTAPSTAPREASTEAPTEAPTQTPTEVPTESPTQASTEPPTEPLAEPSTTPPTEPPTITPTAPPSNEMIGSLYTRSQLEAMDKTHQGCSVGSARDNRGRPTWSIAQNQKYAKYNAHFIAPDDGNIYLTFDCGYEYEGRTAAILDILLEKDVKAVFFVNMHFTQANPNLIRRIIDEGHILANHCSGHPDLPNCSIDKVVNEIMEMHNYVLEHYGYTMVQFRPPSGYFSEQVLAIAQSLGYKTVQYSFAYVDWDKAEPANPTPAIQKMLNSAHPGAIYLLHAISATNVAALPEVIDSLRAAGYNLALYQ